MRGLHKQPSLGGEALHRAEHWKTRIESVRGSRGMNRWFCLGTLLAVVGCLSVFAQDATDASADEREADPGYRYLLMEVSTSVNSKGLKTTRMHHRIEIQKQHAVDAIGDISIPYNAFRSEARVVKAFTQTADGRTVPLAKESVRDLTPDEVSSCQMYSDVHNLTFSMPALGAGAVMDYEVLIEEKKPVMAGNFWVSEFLDAGVQVCTSRVTVAFPARREVKVVTTNLSAQALIADVTNGGARTLTWEMKNIRALEYESGMPPYASVRPQVHITSVASWQQVEEWYADLAKKHLQADEELQRQARQLVGGLSNQLEQIQAIYRYASRDVRYVGVELGRSDYEPHAPRDTIRNKYGDCKDKAALLATLLNAVGIPAYLAIVRPNHEGPVDQSVPGPAQFSHAIVYVPRAEGDLWVDATVPFGEVTEHGYHLDDVEALVIGLPGKTFVHIPVSDETHSVHRLIFDVDVHYGGLCTVREIEEYAGRAAISERSDHAQLDAEKVRKQLEHNLGSGSGYGRLLNYSFTNPTNDCEPMRVTTEYESDTFLTPVQSGLSVRFDAAELRGWLDVPQPDPTSVRKHKRVYPWIVRTAHTEEITCRLHLAQGYELTHTPSAMRKDLPHGKAEMLFDQSGGVPRLTLRVITRPVRLEPGDLPDVAERVDRAMSSLRGTLDVEDGVDELMREHHYAKAETTVVEAARRATNSADAQIRLGLYYKSVGHVYASRLAFEKAVALSPRNKLGYALLADTYTGFWGFPGQGFDRKSILAVYERALTNVPVRSWTLNLKASACLINDLGQGDSTNHLDEAEGYFRELLKDDAQNYKGLFGLGQVNRLRGNYEEAEDYYRKAGRAKPNEAGPHAGIWISMAYAGRGEEAWNAMSEYYGAGQPLNTEAVRVAALLTTARHYETAADLYERLAESSARPEIVQRVARLLRKTAKVKRDNYERFFDNSSPEAVAQTLLIAELMGDMETVSRCLSPAVNRDTMRHSIQAQTGVLKDLIARVGTNFLADIVLSAFETSKRTLDNGDVEVKLDGSKSTSAFGSFRSTTTFQVQTVSNRWQVITVDQTDLDCATLGRVALEALGRGDTVAAMAWQVRLADVACHPAVDGTALPIALHLQEIAFTNNAVCVKAWAGIGLVGSRNRAEIAQAAACLEEVLAAYPQDPELKMALAYAHYQLANVRRAAALLDTIDIARLVAPDQLVRLGWMLLNCERLDAAEKDIARMREVAPDNDQLLLLQSQAQMHRAQYAAAAATAARLRQGTRLDSRAFIPNECMAISLSGNQAALRECVERWREPEKPITDARRAISGSCLVLGLVDEASEQVATMIAEGAMNADAMIGYTEIALARGDTAEARYDVAFADRLAKNSPDYDHLRSLALVHLALGDFAEAARVYREDGTTVVSDYSGHWLCMSALASRLAGDTTAAAETLKLAATMQGDGDWPRLAIQYIRGEISEDEFRRAPERTTVTPLKHRSRECEVNCILGLLKESNHDLPGAVAAYQACVATKSVIDLEYTVAKRALQRLEANRRTGEHKNGENGVGQL